VANPGLRMDWLGHWSRFVSRQLVTRWQNVRLMTDSSTLSFNCLLFLNNIDRRCWHYMHIHIIPHWSLSEKTQEVSMLMLYISTRWCSCISVECGKRWTIFCDNKTLYLVISTAQTWLRQYDMNIELVNKLKTRQFRTNTDFELEIASLNDGYNLQILRRNSTNSFVDSELTNDFNCVIN